MNEVVGKPLSRVDGRLKITGQAKYSADMPVRHVAHAVLVVSSITKGTVKSFDFMAARKVPGFIAFYSHESGFKIKATGMDPKSGGKAGNEEWVPFQDAKIHFNGQQIGLVLAESLEAATRAASLVQVSYSEEPSNVAADKPGIKELHPKDFFGASLQGKTGDPDKVFQSSPPVLLQQTYSTPFEHHHPIEFHATIAQWSGNNLTVFDATQNVLGTQNLLAHMLSMKPEQVKVISHFLGGGFGCKGFFWPHTVIAAIAAKKIGRPVKLLLTREQMFTSNGHRTSTVQEITLAAGHDGKLTAIKHHSSTTTSEVAIFPESCGLVTKMLYECPNIDIAHRLVRINTCTPTPMRAPGETPGTFALESAMDELAYKIGMDPLQLRLVNYAENNPSDKKEFSGKHLRECYEKASQAFGWSQRKMEPRSMKDGRMLVGWGMATASYPANRVGCSASAAFSKEGKLVVKSATQDIGTGTYTVMSQIAADAFDLPMEQVQFELGNSTFPKGVLSGGSQTAASTGPAVRKVCLQLRDKLLKATLADASSPLHGTDEKDILTGGGRFYSSSDSKKSISYVDVLNRLGIPMMEEKAEVQANTREANGLAKIIQKFKNSGGPNTEKYSFHSFGAHFVEVRVDPDSGEIRMGRMVGAFDIGKVLNLKTARSQCIGGMTWGIGQALLEETVFDQASGRIATRNLADYHLPVHADVPPMDVIFIDSPDLNISDVGARGVGELPLTGSAAAIANAVFHATGKRIRDLPILPEKILGV